MIIDISQTYLGIKTKSFMPSNLSSIVFELNRISKKLRNKVSNQYRIILPEIEVESFSYNNGDDWYITIQQPFVIDMRDVEKEILESEFNIEIIKDEIEETKKMYFGPISVNDLQ